jgi:hypothetical protein
MPKAKQLTIAFENRPGTLSHVARVLGDANVNILAFNCGTTGQEGFVHVIVDNANKGKKALSAAGLSCTEADVLQELPNIGGALGYFTGKLAHKEININSSWATTLKGSKKATIVLSVSDVERAGRIR